MTWITQLLPIRKFHITRSSADHLKSKGVSQESPSGRGSSGGPAGSHSAFPAPFPHHLGGERRAEGSPLPASGVQPPPFPGGFPGLPSQALAWTRRSPRSSRQHMHPRPPRFPRRFTRETRAAAAPVPGLEGLRSRGGGGGPAGETGAPPLLLPEPPGRRRPRRPTPAWQARCGRRRPRSIQDGGAARAPSPGRTARGGGGGGLTGGGGGGRAGRAEALPLRRPTWPVCPARSGNPAEALDGPAAGQWERRSRRLPARPTHEGPSTSGCEPPRLLFVSRARSKGVRRTGTPPDARLTGPARRPPKSAGAGRATQARQGGGGACLGAAAAPSRDRSGQGSA